MQTKSKKGGENSVPRAQVINHITVTVQITANIIIRLSEFLL